MSPRFAASRGPARDRRPYAMGPANRKEVRRVELLPVSGGGGGAAEPWALFATSGTSAYIYDGDGWAAVAPPPVNRHNGVRAATLDGLIYTLGHQDGVSPAAELWVYDPSEDRWGQRASCPRAFGWPGLVAYGGRIHQVTGYTSTSGYRSGHHEYDPFTDTWTARASAYNTWGANAAALDGGIHLAFGAYTGGAHNAHYQWTPDAWTSLPNAPASLRYAGQAEVDGDFYVVGGEGAAGATSRKLLRWNSPSGGWDDLGNYPSADRCSCAAGFPSFLLCIAGTSLLRWSPSGGWATLDAAAPVGSASALAPVPL